MSELWYPDSLKPHCSVFVAPYHIDAPMVFQVHVADGIQFVRDINNSLAADEASVVDRNDDASSDTKSPPLSGSCNASNAENRVSTKIDVLIIDVDSSDSRWMQIVNSIRVSVEELRD